VYVDMHVILSMHQIITYKPQGDVAIRVIIVRLVLHGCIVHAGLADSQLLEHLQHTCGNQHLFQ